ncbi:MAG: hypothetical protein R6U46_02455 [Marinilabilia sp.]
MRLYGPPAGPSTGPPPRFHHGSTTIGAFSITPIGIYAVTSIIRGIKNIKISK